MQLLRRGRSPQADPRQRLANGFALGVRRIDERQAEATDVVPQQMTWQDGYLLPPTEPGLGVVFDEEAAKRHPFQMAELPHYRRLDGSLPNVLIWE